ncbi:DUF4302 domain-containing protein [Winogradskyella bathintestinalis]|uniref:DUF4302 domain-containing protein n=1 Tax=Winogradskyella bathintestinalis TaxID=3035208 RepID=A0ABT7ZXT8_9FLAO|nr:DUF4302 domain-containing protein [Winogradskyella bathintestinalis]MDN3493799.1 DUF4302 domain-containing protein [Winogradskyella bathintestinalis]
MKRFFLYKTLVLLVAVFTMVSCNSDDDNQVFSELPGVRSQISINELTTLLLSQQQGYEASYFTNSNQYGGFTVFLNFNSDGTVRQTSDFDDDFDLQNSTFEVRQGTTTELIFKTRNHITKATNPTAEDAYGDIIDLGNGFQGNSNFQFFSNDNGVLTFRDVRQRNTASLVLTPTNFTDFDSESLASVQESYENRLEFVDSPTVTPFPFMQITSSNGVEKYALNYNKSKFFAERRFLEEDNTFTSSFFGMLFTENSIIVNPAVEVDGELLEEFFLDTTSPTLQYVAEVNGVTGIIGYATTPAVPLLGYLDLPEWLILHNPFLNSLADDWTPDLTSPGFDTLIADLNTSITMFNIERIDFNDLNTDSATLYIGSSIGGGNYNISKEIIDDKVYLTITGTTLPEFFTTAIQPLLDVLLDPNGLYVDQPTTLNAFSNRVFTFTSASNTTITFSAVAL